MSEPRDALPGLDLERLETYLQRHAPQLAEAPLRADLVVGGKSNLTYILQTAGGRMVLRRPPLGHVLATAHDMGREFRVMSALAGTDVPVPETVLTCEDPDIIGAPFYLMRAVDGVAIKRSEELAERGAERTEAITRELVRTLARLHRIDQDAVGLGDFGRPVGFVMRQIKRWSSQLEQSRSRDLPGLEQLIGDLTERCPADTGAAIVHGDYRLDNVLVDETDRITAVLDWEMASLGSPSADLALFVGYGERAKDDLLGLVSNVSLAPGYLSRAEIIATYEGVTGRTVEDFEFYLAFSYFKQVGILEGIHYRYVSGQTVGDGYDRIGELVLPLLEAARSTLAAS